MKKILICFLLTSLAETLFAETAAEFNAKAWQHVKEKKYVDALDAFKKAAINDPKNAEYHRYVGWVLLNHLGRSEEALKWFEKTVSLDPENQYVHFDAGNCFANMKNFTAAVSYYETGIDILKRKKLSIDWWIFNNLAYYTTQTSPPLNEKTIIYSENLLSVKDTPDAGRKSGHAWLAHAYMNLHEFGKALQWALKGDPDSWILKTLKPRTIEIAGKINVKYLCAKNPWLVQTLKVIN